MTREVVMPQLGLTMEEGAVVSWQKQLGDWVEKGEVLFVVETDKAQMEVESSDAGYLNSIVVEVGKKVPVGTVIARLGDRPDEASSGTQASALPVGARAASGVSSNLAAPGSLVSTGAHVIEPAREAISSGESPASPRARRLAEELGIDISAVKPARGRRIVEEDVRRFQEGRKAGAGKFVAPEMAQVQRRASTTRKIVAQRMTESFHTAPHFYLGVEANASELVRLREQLLGQNKQQAAVRLTYTDLFLRAMSMALKEHPEANAYWREEVVQLKASVDINFAVQAADGLVAPVIRRVDQLALADLARERQSLTEKAKAGTLSLSEMEGGSATLSNLGHYGVDWFQAILNPPQSVILAIGRIAKRGIVVNDSLAVCPTVMLSLSVDHRVLDGVAGASFLSRIKELIENPTVTLL